MSGSDDVTSPIRITPAFFFLLLTLVDGARHGYAMAQDVKQHSDGAIKLGPGSLYWSLNRLEDVGLIDEVDATKGEPGEERRRYYGLTPLGRDILKKEANTLSKVLRFARAKRVV